MFGAGKSNTAGFSLVEVLVALSIFAVVVTMAVGTLIVLIDANSRAQDLETGITNVSFALDSMSREIRTGYNYYGFQTGDASYEVTLSEVEALMSGSDRSDCDGMCNGIIITESGDSLTAGMGSNRIAYLINMDTGRLERKLGTLGDWEPLTSPDVHIQYFDTGFTVMGTDKADGVSPTVTIFVKGYVDLSGGVYDEVKTIYNAFDIQTSVTQHSLDL